MRVRSSRNQVRSQSAAASLYMLSPVRNPASASVSTEPTMRTIFAPS